MYILQKFKADKGDRSDNQMTHINSDQLSLITKKCKKEDKQHTSRLEVYTIQCVCFKKIRKALMKLSISKSNQQYFDLYVMVKTHGLEKGKSFKFYLIQVVRILLY